MMLFKLDFHWPETAQESSRWTDLQAAMRIIAALPRF